MLLELTHNATVVAMGGLPAEIQQQREVEDKAIKLGKERIDLEARLAQTVNEAIELMDKGVPVERLAQLIGVNRPTLYRWRNAVAILRANRTEGGA